MPPRANIKEPEPDKAKRIVCNPSGEKEISVPLFTEDKETCRFYSGEETIKKSTSNDLMDNTEEAKDIVSETMEQAWKEFDQLKENTRSAWLYATVRNGCLNRLKHLNVEQQHIDRLTEATRAEMNQGYRAHEALLQQAENIARSLPEPTCTILRSCYWEKKTYQQVADELGISPDTVKKHISKALRTLREAILKKEDKQ